MCFHNLPPPSIYQDVTEQVEPWLKWFLSLGSSSERAEWDGRARLIYAKPAAALIFSGQRGATDCHHFEMKKAFNKSFTNMRDLSFQTWPPLPSPEIFLSRENLSEPSLFWELMHNVAEVRARSLISWGSTGQVNIMDPLGCPEVVPYQSLFASDHRHRSSKARRHTFLHFTPDFPLAVVEPTLSPACYIPYLTRNKIEL